MTVNGWFVFHRSKYTHQEPRNLEPQKLNLVTVNGWFVFHCSKCACQEPRNLETRKLNLEAKSHFSQKFVPPKITR